MFVTPEEIKTHLYGELVAAVNRGDDTLLTSAIDGAIAEAKSYLSGFDNDAIFATTGNKRNQLLLIFVKDIAVWHFIALSNPGIDYSERENRYKAATAWLKGVQKGDITPDLPLDKSVVPSGKIIFGSNPKRGEHF